LSAEDGANFQDHCVKGNENRESSDEIGGYDEGHEVTLFDELRLVNFEAKPAVEDGEKQAPERCEDAAHGGDR
jgi:hypothetical protein